FVQPGIRIADAGLSDPEYGGADNRATGARERQAAAMLAAERLELFRPVPSVRCLREGCLNTMSQLHLVVEAEVVQHPPTREQAGGQRALSALARHRNGEAR